MFVSPETPPGAESASGSFAREEQRKQEAQIQLWYNQGAEWQHEETG